jgi:hypothetical protein
VTVGSGIAPDLLTSARGALAGLGALPFTAGGEFHPALRTMSLLPATTAM